MRSQYRAMHIVHRAVKTGSWAPKNWYVSVLMCMDRQRSAKLVAVCQKRREQLTHAWGYACCHFVTRSTTSAVRTVFSLLLPVLALLPIHWQFMHVSTFTGQFLCAQLPLFSVNLAVIVHNVTSPKTQFCVTAKLELKVWRFANFIYVK